MYREHKVVFSVFAGRRDRMELLLEHVDRFVKDGVVDEVHVWDFCRNEDDRVWLRSLPYDVLVTGDEYHYSGFKNVQDASTYAFTVHGVKNDLAMLLTSREGIEYELVLGGWENTNSVFRKGKQATALVSNDTLRLDPVNPNAVSLTWGNDGVLSVTVNECTPWIIPFDDTVHTIAHSTGWGNAGVYEFPGQYKYCKPTSKWHSYYQHYAMYKDTFYAKTIVIKADDDIVHMGSSVQLKAFLDFRLDHPEYSLVFPNIVNNGATAYLQKKHGVLPEVQDELEDAMPTIGGKLWNSASLARRLHEKYIADPGAFVYDGFEPIPPKHRVSINFFAVLPSMLETFPRAGDDDEQYLTVVHPGQKAVFNGFAVSHLSFHPQERDIDATDLIQKYRDLRVVVADEPVVQQAPKKRGRKKKVLPISANPHLTEIGSIRTGTINSSSTCRTENQAINDAF
jgi:hypothetical protein